MVRAGSSVLNEFQYIDLEVEFWRVEVRGTEGRYVRVGVTETVDYI